MTASVMLIQVFFMISNVIDVCRRQAHDNVHTWSAQYNLECQNTGSKGITLE